MFAITIMYKWIYVLFNILFVSNISKPCTFQKNYLPYFISFEKSSNVSLSKIIARGITKTAFIWTGIIYVNYNYSFLHLFITHIFLYLLHIYSSIYYIFIHLFTTIDRHKKGRDNLPIINIQIGNTREF